jgi:hypothetical protein
MDDILKDIAAQLAADPKQAFVEVDQDDFFTPAVMTRIEDQFPNYVANTGSGRGSGSWVQLLPKD